MKLLAWLTLFGMASAITVSSCNNDKNPAQQYGNTIVQPLKSAKKLDATVNVLEVKKSIQEFYAANGRYPADLNELATFNGMTLKSDQFDYDPATGNLTEKR
jgi:hypothetical protein